MIFPQMGSSGFFGNPLGFPSGKSPVKFIFADNYIFAFVLGHW